MNTEVEELLREGMERFTADLRAPAGLLNRAEQRRRRRRLAVRSAGGAAAALTAGAAALAVVMVPGGVGLGTSAGAAVDAAYVVKHVGNALNAAEPGDIAQMTITTTGAGFLGGKAATTTAEEWSYGNQWRAITYSSPGHPVYDEGANASSVYTLVSYLTKTWARESGVGQPTPLPSGFTATKHGCTPAFTDLPLLFRFGLPGIGTTASSLPSTVATALRTAVSCGSLEAAGHQQVDGVNAIELKSRADSFMSETIWVNPSTYLPVRVVVQPSPGGPGLQQTADISWLPATAQNLAKLTVPIPAGFRQVTFAQAGTPILQKLPARLVPRPAAFCPPSTGPACLFATGGAPRPLLAPKFTSAANN
jgi:hypothetical protein